MISAEQHAVIRARIDEPATTNDERSAVEVFEFCRDRPERYFLYVASDNKTVTTWTGEKLGDVIFIGREWQDNFGGKRRSIEVRAINGCRYVGQAMVSAGTYARLRKAK